MNERRKHYAMLNNAISVATLAHRHDVDKSGKPYILHPLKLMFDLMYDPELATIAVLHDVIEDSNATIETLKETNYFNDRVLNALELLTHDPGDSYEEYIEKICTNLDAITVKRKDLQHNSDITRLKGVTDYDLARIKKYHKAFLRLGKARNELKGEN